MTKGIARQIINYGDVSGMATSLYQEDQNRIKERGDYSMLDMTFLFVLVINPEEEAMYLGF